MEALLPVVRALPLGELRFENSSAEERRTLFDGQRLPDLLGSNGDTDLGSGSILRDEEQFLASSRTAVAAWGGGARRCGDVTAHLVAAADWKESCLRRWDIRQGENMQGQQVDHALGIAIGQAHFRTQRYVCGVYVLDRHSDTTRHQSRHAAPQLVYFMDDQMR